MPYHPNFILGIDGGGSKTIGRLVDINTRQQWQVKVGGASLTNDFDNAWRTIQQLILQLFNQSGASAQQVVAVIGVAGAGSSARAAKLREHLALPFAELVICNDARTSLFGANLGEPVAVVALGTGSVGARLDLNGQTAFFGGWGFNAGDEGGGAKLGLHAVQAMLAEFDQAGQLHSALANIIADQIGRERNAILTWLSASGPADFARFSQYVFELASSCPVARKIIDIHCQHVEQLITDTRADTNLPLVMLGGLAEPTQPYLSSHIQHLLIEAKGTALDGGCLMAQRIIEQRINLGVTHNAS
ncbi:BadF/BadG/BcrA/BcrD ATPase family protein [Neptunicella sp.]|uniref:BadF/BadG/BcrA/BcrD ATPase family protein n=1 Tax=Neptunicella sp. TaxID=2125986 RepID=UPI003F69241E